MANLNAQEIEFFNFLQKYDLQQYFDRLREDGVKKIGHLQHVKSEDLEKIGMSKPERQRLLGKYEQHFSKLGKLKVSLLNSVSLLWSKCMHCAAFNALYLSFPPSGCVNREEQEVCG